MQKIAENLFLHKQLYTMNCKDFFYGKYFKTFILFFIENGKI